MNRHRIILFIVGGYLWLMMILLGSIVLETFMVYPNIFHDPPESLTTALEFMTIRAPSDFYPPLGFLSWVFGAASLIAAWPVRPARYWIALSVAMILGEGLSLWCSSGRATGSSSSRARCALRGGAQADRG